MEKEHLHPSRPAVTSPATAPSGAADIAEEHRALRELLGRVTATRDLGRLLPLLGELAALLEEHFTHEEAADGLHAQVAESAPDRLPEVQRLFTEHREVSERLAALVARAEGLWQGQLAEVLAEAAALAAYLHRHEAAEGELLAGALYDDLGSGS
jgi:hypothetical protein